MKKTIIKLFLFFTLICILCFYIYKLTDNKHNYLLSIGDGTINNRYLNSDYIYYEPDFRIIDLIDTIKYPEDSNISIYQLLEKADYLILAIGMNDLYYILDEEPKDIYPYIDKMLNNYKELLKMINRYRYKKVIVLGYYNIYDNYQDIFTYTNYRLNKLTNKYHYKFINTDKIINKNSNYLEKKTNFTLNNRGYYQIYQVLVEKIPKS